MTTPDLSSIPNIDPEVQQIAAAVNKEEGKRRWLLLLLLSLLLLLCAVGVFAIRYASRPQPLPDMLPQVISKNINYPPVYTFSMSGVDKPVGVAVSPDGQRIYVVESAGERLIKMFDRDGKLITTFTPPGTNKSNRKPTYIAVDAQGRVFVTDHYNHVIDVFDADGNFIDAIITPDMTLSEYVSKHNNGNLPAGTLYYYDNVTKLVFYQFPGEALQNLPAPDRGGWTPLGLRFDGAGNLLTTNLASGKHGVMVFPAAAITGSWLDFNPQSAVFGTEGKEKGQFSFPNSVVLDSRGNYYVSDGNNGRISQWGSTQTYQDFFGFGSSDSALNLPRGMWMDSKDHLHVADAVGQYIRVYDVSAEQPTFLYSFGDFGNGPGMFNYPTDVCMDATGRVYVADSENDRVQVWSY